MPGHFAGRRSRLRRRNQSRHRAVHAMTEMLESRILMAVAPIINEFLASNGSTNTDEDAEATDWVEVYNPNSTPVSLNGYYLTDKSSELTQWKFPNVSLAGNGYLLVWASGKDR